MRASEEVNDLGPRWAYLLREQVYVGPHKAKRIAAEWGVSVGLAKVWLAGGRPTSEQIASAHSRWGGIVLHVLFGRSPFQSVAERLSAVENEIAALKSGAESPVAESHRIAADKVPHLASGGERASSAVVGAADGEKVDHDGTWVGWLLQRRAEPVVSESERRQRRAAR